MTSWTEIIRVEAEKDYFKQIIATVQEDSKTCEVYPPRKDIFNAFKYCPFNQTKILILGQDPYHSLGEAHGLSFSVPKGIAIPPSLQNIFKELKADVGIDPPNHGCLIDWAKQGVLLLNSFLTVKKNQPGSHKNIGWQIFTNHIISLLNEKEDPVAFILWGSFARSKKSFISHQRHLILESVHPSPLSSWNGFFGSKPFSKANQWLDESGLTPIDWTIKGE